MEAERASQGQAAPVTPPKAAPPGRSPGGVKVEKGEKEKEEPVSGSKVVPKPTPKSPPPTGISSPSSQTAGGDKSPGEGSRKSLGEEAQRRKFAKGNYGDMRVKFADPIDNRGKDGKKGGEKGRSKGKGKGKGKSKSKKGQPSKGKNKGPRKASPSMEATNPNELPGRATALGWVHQALDEGPGGGAYEDGRPVEGSP